jgi:hypothetical protein
MFCFRRKQRKLDSRRVQPPVLSFIRDSLVKDPIARVLSVRLFLKKYNLKLDYIRDSQTWVSHVEGGCVAMLSVSFSSSLGITVDEILGSYRIVDSRALQTPTYTLSMIYDSSISAPEWSLIIGPEWIPEPDFELAETIEGPFPLAFLLSYLHLSQHMIYTRKPPGVGENLKGSSAKEEKDFSIGFVIYLSHLSEIFQDMIDTCNYPFSIKLARNQSLLKTERQTIANADGIVSEPLRRIYNYIEIHSHTVCLCPKRYELSVTCVCIKIFR